VIPESQSRADLLRRFLGGESVESLAAEAAMSPSEAAAWVDACQQVINERTPAGTGPSMTDLVQLITLREAREIRRGEATGETAKTGARSSVWLSWAVANWVVIAGLAATVLWLWKGTLDVAVVKESMELHRTMGTIQKDLSATLNDLNAGLRAQSVELKQRNTDLEQRIRANETLARDSSKERASAERKVVQQSTSMQAAVKNLENLKQAQGPAETKRIDAVIQTLQIAPTPAPGPASVRVTPTLQVTPQTAGLVFDGKYCVQSTFRGSIAYCFAPTQEQCERSLVSLPTGTHKCIVNPGRFFCYAWKPKTLDYPLASCSTEAEPCEASRQDTINYSGATDVGPTCSRWPA
jgi:hypothetical protein